MWVGEAYAARGTLVLQVLVAANMIRLSAVPYAMALIGTGQQRLVTITPLVEGIFNLSMSVVAGFFYGSLGVALGTLLGSLAGVGGNFIYNMPRTIGVQFRVADYIYSGLFRPLVCAMPLIVAALLPSDFCAIPMVRHLGFAFAFPLTAYLTWRWGLVHAEREKLRLRYFVGQWT